MAMVNMEKQLIVPKLSTKNFVGDETKLGFECDKCKVIFGKPILATVSSNGHVQSYYACPRCLSKIHMKTKKTNVVVAKKTEKINAKSEKIAGCKHFFGFLKKRPKNSPIPDECLTCSRMIECLTR